MGSGTNSKAISVKNIQDAIARFQKTPDRASISALRNSRHMIALHMLRSPVSELASPWGSALRKISLALAQCGLRDLSRDGTEESLADNVRTGLVSAWEKSESAGMLLAGMLLCHNYELPLPPNFIVIPDWLREDYAKFLLERPPVHNRVGDADAYTAFLFRAVALLHGTIMRERDTPITRQLTRIFTDHADFLQAYFNTDNLGTLYAQRGDIIAATLLDSGHQTLTVFPPRDASGDKIRLGIFAQYFAQQTETYFTLAHFDFLDRSQFDITLYALKKTDHPLERHCIERADRFVVLPTNDLAAHVRRIRADDLDILLISTNMTAVTNPAVLLGAHRLARIQVASGSSPVTTGTSSMDIFLTAEWNEPAEDASSHYTEYLYRMPGSLNYYAYQYDTEPAVVSLQRSKLGIADEQIVFFSGANYFKILPEVSLTWARILAAVPDSVLLLMPFNPNWSPQYQTRPFVERILRQMRERGVDPKRLRVVNPVATRADVHKVLALADVYLDAFPFAGACSLLDSFIVGVPPVTRAGAVGRSQHGASLLHMVDLEELIAYSEEQYIKTAVELAGDSAKRRKIKQHLVNLNTGGLPPYLDTKTFSAKVGAAFADLRQRYAAHYRRIEQADTVALPDRLQRLADIVVGHHSGLDALTDIGIVRGLIEPFFRAHGSPRPLHLIDVGACYGQMSLPFLTEGWSAELFEPDPSARQILEKNMAPFGSRCRIHAAAVGNASANEISFHKARTHGLSGLGPSPFGATENVITVPHVTLADFGTEKGLECVDFLKIDAEGYDFDVLEGFDFSRLTPRLVLVEYGTQFPRQTVPSINRAIKHMADHGYRALIFKYTDDGAFAQGRWSYHLTDLFVTGLLGEECSQAFGNILFYRADDKAFLLTLHALLDSCLPRARFWTEIFSSGPLNE